MEYIHGNTFFSGLSLCLILCDIRIKGFLSFFLFYFHSLCHFISQNLKACTSNRPAISEPLNQSSNCNIPSVRLSKEEVVTVMRNLGVSDEFDWDGKGLNEVFGEKEIAELFEKEPPSLAEVKNAFQVFDDNADGFIEARELQKVLKCLGLEKDLGECKRMINAVDLNGDELIDQDEFIKFMLQNFG